MSFNQFIEALARICVVKAADRPQHSLSSASALVSNLRLFLAEVGGVGSVCLYVFVYHQIIYACIVTVIRTSGHARLAHGQAQEVRVSQFLSWCHEQGQLYLGPQLGSTLMASTTMCHQ